MKRQPNYLLFISTVVLWFVLLISNTNAPKPQPDPFKPEKPMDADTKTIVDKVEGAVKNAISTECSKPTITISKITPKSYRTQRVAGTNYFVNYEVTSDSSATTSCFHARMFRDLKNNVSYIRTIGPKKCTDPIEYIEPKPKPGKMQCE